MSPFYVIQKIMILWANQECEGRVVTFNNSKKPL